jgi:nucleoside-diphosphate-sugar epimerase
MIDGPILVTGGAGFIGNRTLEFLSNDFPDLQIFSVYKSEIKPDNVLNNVEWLHCNLIDDDLLKRLPSNVRIILHMAADSRSFYSGFKPSDQFITNVNMTNNLIKYGAKIGIDLFTFTSSVYVYSGCDNLPFKEKFVSIPVETLGASKMACESLLKVRAFADDFKAISFRIFTVYGPNSRESQFLPQAIKKIKAPDSEAKFGNPNSKRDFIYIDDVARGIISGFNINSKKVYEVMNLGTGKSTIIGDVILNVAKLLCSEKNIIFSDRDEHHEVTFQEACLDHTTSISDWRPTVSLNEGLKKMVKYYTNLDDDNE